MPVSTFFIKDINGEKQIQDLEVFLTKVNGVERALFDTDDHEIKIEYNEKEIELKKIVENIEGQGFQIQ
ncbi:heavy-metal-associated domain-containing protein [Litchfieldia salsa]|uniref:HMA domain-containing protein n=1 Tax=Litchfieldia salsa TaxID=930152 RepID=A0A1H0P8N8_9BACI|nr:heavy-metal-associated domain-containing protein [Litchfieldia salsa]SDP01477.1 hypothetical protein SAMN05216565_101211 [Litchfieldia salsa]